MEHPNTRVGIALFDGAEELDWAGPWEVLSYWSWYKPEDHIEVFTVARDNSRPMECAKGLRVLADHSWDSAPEIDVLVVPGGRSSSADRYQEACRISFVAHPIAIAPNLLHRRAQPRRLTL